MIAPYVGLHASLRVGTPCCGTFCPLTRSRNIKIFMRIKKDKETAQPNKEILEMKEKREIKNKQTIGCKSVEVKSSRKYFGGTSFRQMEEATTIIVNT